MTRTATAAALASAHFDTPVEVVDADAGGPVVLVCEHAHRHIPPRYRNLGLAEADLDRHIAWDPGALALARRLARRLDAPLVYATHSRLLIDVNRALSAHDSIVERSEGTEIPGNQALSEPERLARQRGLYEPFHAALARLLASRRARGLATVAVSVHSFTPRFHGQARPWQVGILSDRDRRLADALLEALRADPDLCVGDNAPYAPADGVFHTLDRHAQSAELPCAMIEVRNDLIADESGLEHWAGHLQQALARALTRLYDAREHG